MRHYRKRKYDLLHQGLKIMNLVNFWMYMIDSRNVNFTLETLIAAVACRINNPKK